MRSSSSNSVLVNTGKGTKYRRGCARSLTQPLVLDAKSCAICLCSHNCHGKRFATQLAIFRRPHHADSGKDLDSLTFSSTERGLTLGTQAAQWTIQLKLLRLATMVSLAGKICWPIPMVRYAIS